MTKTPEELIADLRVSCQEFLHSLDGLSEEDVLKRPAPSEWSAWEICYHVATGEMFLVAKLSEILHRDKPSAARRLMATWAKLREQAVALAAEIPSESRDRSGLFTTYAAQRTPASMFQSFARHVRIHQRQQLEARGLLAAAAAIAVPAPGDEAGMTTEELIADMRASCQEFLESFADLSEEDVLTRPAPTEWSAWETCYHLATSEMPMIAKLCEAIHPDKPSAARRLMATWASFREEAILLAREIPPEQWDQPGLFSTLPEWSPRKLLRSRSGHDREHARQTLEARGLLVTSDG